MLTCMFYSLSKVTFILQWFDWVNSVSTGGLLRHRERFAFVGRDLHVGGLLKQKQEPERGENTVYTYMNITAGRGEGAEVGGWNFQRRTSRNNKGIKCRESERKSMCPRCNVRVRQLRREMEAVWHWNQNKDSSIMRGRWWVKKKKKLQTGIGCSRVSIHVCFHLLPLDLWMQPHVGPLAVIIWASQGCRAQTCFHCP